MECCTKYFEKSSMHVGDMHQTNAWYFIIFSDLDLAYIDLNYMCHSQNPDNGHLNYKKSQQMMVPIHIFIILFEPWLLCMTLTAGTWLSLGFRLKMVNICAKLYGNPDINIEVLLWTNIFQWALSVTLTFDLETLFICRIKLLIMVYISMKFQ
jgi:hypothetical protein